MYTPPHFREDDPDRLLAMMQAARLATLVTVGPDGPEASHLPLLVRRIPAGPGEAGFELAGHLARANGQWRRIDPARPALVIFQGPDGYVSPGWYPSKAEGGRVVPTWNYVAVHATGRIRLVEDTAGLLSIVTALTEKHETGRAEPWAVTDAPADYLAANLKGIVGFVLTVERLEGKYKLSQNKSAADHAGVIAGLSASPDPRDRELAETMRAAAEFRS